MPVSSNVLLLWPQHQWLIFLSDTHKSLHETKALTPVLIILLLLSAQYGQQRWGCLKVLAHLLSWVSPSVSPVAACNCLNSSCSIIYTSDSCCPYRTHS